MHDVYAAYFIRHPTIIGGHGHVVEIDESAFPHCKYNVGRAVPTQWVFRGIDPATQEGFWSGGEEGRRDTVGVANPTAICIAWYHSGFRSLEGIQHSKYPWLPSFHGEPQCKLCRSRDTTNHVESMWSKEKRKKKSECGTSRTLVSTQYLLGGIHLETEIW